MVSQLESENSGCLDRTFDVSQSSSYLTIEEEEVFGTDVVHSDLNKLFAEAAVEHSILVDIVKMQRLFVHVA